MGKEKDKGERMRESEFDTKSSKSRGFCKITFQMGN
jgi:hypothetical protein